MVDAGVNFTNERFYTNGGSANTSVIPGNGFAMMGAVGVALLAVLESKPEERVG